MKSVKTFLAVLLSALLVICVGVGIYSLVNKDNKGPIVTNTDKIITLVKGENGDYKDTQDEEDFDNSQVVESIKLSLFDTNQALQIQYYNSGTYVVAFGGYLDSSFTVADTFFMGGTIKDGATMMGKLSEKNTYAINKKYVVNTSELSNDFSAFFFSSESGLFRLTFKEDIISATYQIVSLVHDEIVKSNYKFDNNYSIKFDLSLVCNFEVFNVETEEFEGILNKPVIEITANKNNSDKTIDDVFVTAKCFMSSIFGYKFSMADVDSIPASTVAPVVD